MFFFINNHNLFLIKVNLKVGNLNKMMPKNDLLQSKLPKKPNIRHFFT